jgi:hypothetical protein
MLIARNLFFWDVPEDVVEEIREGGKEILLGQFEEIGG